MRLRIKTASYVVINRSTGEFFGTFNHNLAKAVCRSRYRVVSILTWLQELNRK